MSPTVYTENVHPNSAIDVKIMCNIDFKKLLYSAEKVRKKEHSNNIFIKKRLRSVCCFFYTLYRSAVPHRSDACKVE